MYKEDTVTSTAKQWLEKTKDWALKNTKTAVLAGTAAIPIGLLCIGGYIVVTATVFAMVSVAAFGILVWKMNQSGNAIARRVYRLMANHPLTTDAGFTALVYLLSPGGTIGMLGAAIAAVLASGVLILMKEKTDEDTIETVEPCQVGC